MKFQIETDLGKSNLVQLVWLRQAADPRIYCSPPPTLTRTISQPLTTDRPNKVDIQTDSDAELRPRLQVLWLQLGFTFPSGSVINTFSAIKTRVSSAPLGCSL